MIIMEQPNNKKIKGALYKAKDSVENIDPNKPGYDPPRFYTVIDGEINKNEGWHKHYILNVETVLILVEPNLDFNDGEYKFYPGTMAAGIMTYESMDSNILEEIWESKGYIPGSVFMVPDGRLIWISDVDFEYFEQIELNNA